MYIEPIKNNILVHEKKNDEGDHLNNLQPDILHLDCSTIILDIVFNFYVNSLNFTVINIRSKYTELHMK